MYLGEAMPDNTRMENGRFYQYRIINGELYRREVVPVNGLNGLDGWLKKSFKKVKKRFKKQIKKVRKVVRKVTPKFVRKAGRKIEKGVKRTLVKHGGIIAGAASIIPGIGPVVSTGIKGASIALQARKAKKQVKKAKKALAQSQAPKRLLTPKGTLAQSQAPKRVLTPKGTLAKTRMPLPSFASRMRRSATPLKTTAQLVRTSIQKSGIKLPIQTPVKIGYPPQGMPPTSIQPQILPKPSYQAEPVYIERDTGEVKQEKNYLPVALAAAAAAALIS